MYAVMVTNCKQNPQRAGGDKLARKDYPHDKRLYVKSSDFGLWERFKAQNSEQSSVIMKLVRLYMEGRLHDESGKLIERL